VSEPDGFTSYVAARGRALWRAAWLLTGDAALAEDLVQTALAKAWPHYDRVARDGSFEAYVRRAMVTTYASWWGRRWRGELPTAELPDDAGSERVPDPDLVRALGELSPRQRAVVVLRYFEDLSEPETAAALGCSVGTVKTHHARALHHLRGSSLLADELPEEAR
jgi:RNA polymerase sigma-70 factor (sigma-E family)